MNGLRAIHPGEILREEYLEPMGLSASALAIALRLPAPRVNDIVRERRGISPDTALRLARFFGTSPQFWMNLQSGYELKVASAASGKRVQQEVRPHAD
jgi:addiction module HigA family antidote